MVVIDTFSFEILQMLGTCLHILLQTFLHNLSHYYDVIADAIVDVSSMFSEKASEMKPESSHLYYLKDTLKVFAGFILCMM